MHVEHVEHVKCLSRVFDDLRLYQEIQDTPWLNVTGGGGGDGSAAVHIV